MHYIYNETPVGVIDWVNKTFTTSENIAGIEEVYLWWASYRSVSFNWNTFTLTDAPLVWMMLSIDYYTDLNIVPDSWNIKFIDIINEVYDDYIKQNKTSKTYPLETVKRFINKCIMKLNNNVYNNVIREYSLNKVEKLNAREYVVDWVIVWENRKYIPASWYATVWWVLFPYSSYTAWKLVWNVPVVYENWAAVNIWYKIPSYVKKVAEVIIDGFNLKVWDNRNPWYWEYYITTVSWWDRYIFIPVDSNTKVITVKYYTLNWILENDEDIVNFPYEYSDVICYYVSYTMAMTNEDDRYEDFKNTYNERKREYLWYRTKSIWIKNTIRSNVLPNI